MKFYLLVRNDNVFGKIFIFGNIDIKCCMSTHHCTLRHNGTVNKKK